MTPITESFAGAVAAEYYGVTAPVRALPGEFDRNFELAPPNGQGYILKFSHPDTPDFQLDYENALMAHLAGLPVPRLLLNRRSEAVTRLPSGARARMLTRLPGRRLADVAPRPPALLFELGALLGRLDRELQTFDHPAMRREWLWDLTLAAEVIRPRLLFVPQPDRAAVAEALKRFESRAAPVLPDLPGQAIHNDANDYNVLVVPEETGWKISGLVDFGDSLYAPRVCEAAIAAAYALLGETDPPAAAQAVAQGYHRENPLLPAELDVFWDLVITRLAVSVAVAAGRAAERSGNAYHQASAAPAARALIRLLSAGPEAALRAARVTS